MANHPKNSIDDVIRKLFDIRKRLKKNQHVSVCGEDQTLKEIKSIEWDEATWSVVIETE